MSERRTLHPLYMAVGLFSIIKGFIPVLIIIFINRRGKEWPFDPPWLWFAGIGVIVISLLLIIFLQWRRFGFWLEEDRIVIRKGLLFRDEKTIYYSRIHSVNVEQPLVHRLLRVAQVKIETPGGSKNAEGVLEVLSLKAANDIKVHLRGRAKGVEAEAGEVADAITGTGAVAVTDTIANSEAMPASEGIQNKEVSFRLDAAELLKAAATSMNFGLVAAFFAGLFSFADDIIELLLPDRFLENVVEDTTSFMPDTILVVILIVFVLTFAWLLSIALYVIKFSGFTVRKDGKQISVSYGLLEKKTFLFDPQKVQAVIVSEGLLRQPFGFAEVKLQVVSSDENEQLMIHPFIKRSHIGQLLNDFVPKLKQPTTDGFAKSPRRAFIYYVRFELLLVIAACTALIVLFKEAGLPSLLLLPLVIWWRNSCHRAAGMKLEDGQLTLRRRFISRVTYYIRRPQIVTMKVKRSIGQRRKELLTLSVQALGSSTEYQVSCLNHADVEPVWQWYSRRNTKGNPTKS